MRLAVFWAVLELICVIGLAAGMLMGNVVYVAYSGFMLLYATWQSQRLQ